MDKKVEPIQFESTDTGLKIQARRRKQEPAFMHQHTSHDDIHPEIPLYAGNPTPIFVPSIVSCNDIPLFLLLFPILLEDLPT